MRKALVLLAASTLLAQGPALPVLGQTYRPPAAQAPRTAQLRAVERQLAAAGARVTAMSDSRGNRLHVYLDRGGRVFGLAWQGVSAPDLRAMLGPYFSAFQRAAARPHRRGPMEVRVNGLVVDLGGHMRALRGRAYLAPAIPQGLTAEVVQ
jgi:hypothetical protein